MALDARLHICFIMTVYYKMRQIITKCDSYCITKCDRGLFYNASGFLLQNATVITKCDSTKSCNKSVIYSIEEKEITEKPLSRLLVLCKFMLFCLEFMTEIQLLRKKLIFQSIDTTMDSKSD